MDLIWKFSLFLGKLVFLLLVLSTVAEAQSKDPMSVELLSHIQHAKSDSLRLHYKVELAKHLLNKNIDTSRIILDDVLHALDQISNPSQYLKRNKADALNYWGIINAKQGLSEEALATYLQALELSESIKDSSMIGLTIHNLGMFYRRQHEYEKAKAYLQKALHIRHQIQEKSSDIAMSYNMLGVTYFYNKQYDSALINYKKAEALYTTKHDKSKVNGNLALLYYTLKDYDKAIFVFKENIQIFKELQIQNELSIYHKNLAGCYQDMGLYEKAIQHLDSAIAIAEKLKHKDLLQKEYFNRSLAYQSKGDYKKALADFSLYKAYNDSLNNTEEAKRITALELNYTFEKEKLQANFNLETERSKKQLYLILFVLTAVSAVTIFVLVRKNTKYQLDLSKRKLEEENLQRKNAEQILQLKEAELKTEFLNNKIKEEVQHYFEKELKAILKLSEEERTKAIKSLLLSVKSKSSDYGPSQNLTEYIDQVSHEFKIKINTHFPFFNEKEKKLLYLMKLGLSTNEIKDLQNTSLASVKSIRYRIRKKLEIDSEADIIAYIDNYPTTT